ncbi:MAG: rubrerythrin [uncultured bacterium]|nr:MAG: rubrerythrin [uncultured bacterium]HBH18653.1 reverse rubrerythrin [Cyanobacteria bacterium UBA9579]
MIKFVCLRCGYVASEEGFPEACPVCGASKESFEEIKETDSSTTAKNLEANWDAETEEVGLYLAFAKKAEEEGLPEVAQTFMKIAIEEGYHAAEIAEIQGKVKSTKENLEWRVEAERGAQLGKKEAAEIASNQGNQDAAKFFDRASKDEGRHAAMFQGFLNRYFSNKP